jgi:nucleoside-diphosphate-sugar epimerase
MHVFITGATGFVGHYVLQELLNRGHTARCLVRAGSESQLPIPASDWIKLDTSVGQSADGLNVSEEESGAPAEQTSAASTKVEVVSGDLGDLASMPSAATGCDAVIHLVGIIDENRNKGITFERIHVEGTRNIVQLAQAARVPRFIYMSANGARANGDASGYHTSKWQAEEIVRGAGFDYTVIFRPSIIFGDPGEGRPEFASRLAETLIRPFPILPVFGKGDYTLQPIYIGEVAKAFVDALTLEPQGEQAAIYYPAGPEILTYVEVLDRIAQGMGLKPKPKLYSPLWAARLLVNTVGALGLLPISPAQFKMLIEGNNAPDTAFVETFKPEHRPFTPENLTYLRR